MKTKVKNIPNENINVITLGCSKNTVDSEMLMGQLAANGKNVMHEGTLQGGTVIINTCGFIENAKEESINTILNFAERRKNGELDKLIVMGCLSERYQQELKLEIKNVDGWFGTHHLPEILKSVGADYKKELLGERLQTTPKHYAYVKISEGCNRPCAFCAIPLMRGNHTSKPYEELEFEIKGLVRNGIKEIMLIAQDTTYYGIDIYGERKLPELLKRLANIDGLEWIRLHYAYPSQFPLKALDVMREYKNICNYIDMPLQHITDNMLKTMRRGITKQRTQKLVDQIRNKIPDIGFRTTLLVGHPGETEKDQQELMEFVAKNKFDRLGVFTYSHEENTAAYQLPDSIPQPVKQERADEVMTLQEEISAELNQAKIGQTYKILIDKIDGENYVGRSEYDSPEVDNEVLVSTLNNYARLGDFVNVKITDATEFDLIGEVV
ncbi:MAG: 30S ribosomal protein S12 methylthiotransferase RimO [Bacteroidetes bacterium]|nr:30S ribosomal protein S12 methylthiotransferase RimO [Bacteroidota bacterium]